MEEILASIRRIISDGEEGEGEGEGDGNGPVAVAEQVAAAEEPEIEAPSQVFSALPSGEPEPEAEEDILDLTQMVTEQGEVVDLNEAKSARGLGPAAVEPAEAVEATPEAAADDDAELTMEGLARALDEVIGEAPAAEPADDAIALAPEVAAVETDEVVLAGAEEAVEEPLSPLDALAEIEALAANQQAEMEAAAGREAEASQAFDPPALEPQALEPEPLEPEALEEAPAPVEPPAPEEPLELADQFAAEEPLDSADDALSEIDQILARAREAAQAQAAKILEEEPETPPLSPADETAALLAGLEQREEVPPPGRGIPDDIRTAVEESLGGGAQKGDSRSGGQDPFEAVIQAEANMAGVEAQADSAGEEQNLADRKDSSHPNYRSRGDEADSGLISSNTAAGAIAALGDLSRAARENTGGQGGGTTALGMNRTLEELVLDAMTPHLKSWLDTNLEPLVERVVREEIQRLRRRSEDY